MEALEKSQKYLRTHDIDAETYDFGDYYVIIDTVKQQEQKHKREKVRECSLLFFLLFLLFLFRLSSEHKVVYQ